MTVKIDALCSCAKTPQDPFFLWKPLGIDRVYEVSSLRKDFDVILFWKFCSLLPAYVVILGMHYVSSVG